MELTFDVKTLRQLWDLAGASARLLASLTNLDQGTVYSKLNGRRAWFADELEHVAEAINNTGNLPIVVAEEDIVKLLGADNVHVRGTLAQQDKEVQGDE